MPPIIATFPLLKIHPLEWLIWFSMAAPIISGVIEHHLTRSVIHFDNHQKDSQ